MNRTRCKFYIRITINLRAFRSDGTFVITTLYSDKLSHILKKHFNLVKTVPSARGHLIFFIASSGLLCRYLSLGKIIEQYSQDKRVVGILICFLLQLFNVSCNCLMLIQHSYPKISLYLGVNFFN